MKYVCRKCMIVFRAEDVDSLQDLADIQTMTCGGGGTHRLIGVKD